MLFYKVHISINFKKFILVLEFFVLSIALAWNRNHFVPRKGNNSNEKNVKSI